MNKLLYICNKADKMKEINLNENMKYDKIGKECIYYPTDKGEDAIYFVNSEGKECGNCGFTECKCYEIASGDYEVDDNGDWKSVGGIKLN